MIESFDDLGLDTEDGEEGIDKKVQDKLGCSLEQMKTSLSEYLLSHADEVAAELMNIAPHGDYEKLIEDASGMAEFIKTDVSKNEYWKLFTIKTIQDQVLQFVFTSSAVDDGETFEGHVVVSFAGKIKHAFCQGEN